MQPGHHHRGMRSLRAVCHRGWRPNSGVKQAAHAKGAKHHSGFMGSNGRPSERPGPATPVVPWVDDLQQPRFSPSQLGQACQHCSRPCTPIGEPGHGWKQRGRHRRGLAAAGPVLKVREGMPGQESHACMCACMQPTRSPFCFRLSKDQTPLTVPLQPSASNKPYLAAARPRPSSPPPLGKHTEPPAWSAEHFVTIAWTFGRARHYHRLWHKMASVLVQYPDRFLYRMSPEGLTKLAVGYAQVKVFSTPPPPPSPTNIYAQPSLQGKAPVPREFLL
jgi:hypothetical protein